MYLLKLSPLLLLVAMCVFFSLGAADKTEASVSLLEKVLGHTDDHAEEVKLRAKVSVCTQFELYRVALQY